MEIKKKAPPFDEKAREAAEILLENFWVLRREDSETYRLIREREHPLRTYFREKVGFQLIVNPHLAKLEKIPAEPESWMGVADFIEVREYVLFCTLMAYLESKTVEEQFLLSDLCDQLNGYYPEGDGLDWTNYNHRRSLVRVLQYAQEQKVINAVEGDVSGFGFDEEQEVLYEVPLVARYFMPSYPRELPEFTSLEEILSGEWREMSGMEEEEGLRRRHRVYRKLMLSPGSHFPAEDDPDLNYLRKFRHRIAEDVAQHTPFRFELHARTTLLALPERRARHTFFPESKALSDIAMQLAGVVREKLHRQQLSPRQDGSLELTGVEFERWVEECWQRFGAGWSKEYREALITKTAQDVLKYLQEWKMARRDPEKNTVILFPLLGRITGRYPTNFNRKNTGEAATEESGRPEYS